MLDRSEGPTLADVELERALIGLVFEDAQTLDKIGDLEPDDLSDAQLGAILMAAIDLHQSGQPVSVVTMLPRLRGIVEIDGTTGLDIVRSLTMHGRRPEPEQVASRLRRLAERRRLADYLHSLGDAALDETLSPAALAQDASGQLGSFLVEKAVVEDTHSLTALADDFLRYLQSDVDAVEITTGFKDLDEATGGWHRGQFAILAGRPGMGKSTLALSSMLKTSEKHGVLFFSLEMPAYQVIARALCDLAYTDPKIMYAALRPRQVTDSQIARLTEAVGTLARLNIEIETRSGLNLEEIVARTEATSKKMRDDGKRLDLVVIDHMLKISPSGRYAGQPVKELDEISEGMCRLAKRFDVAVLGLHQLNRSNEGRENQRPMLSDLRGSGSLEQDADLVLFCYRPGYRYERLEPNTPEEREEIQLILREIANDLDLQIAKQRQGATANIDLWCDITCNAVRNKSFRR